MNLNKGFSKQNLWNVSSSSNLNLICAAGRACYREDVCFLFLHFDKSLIIHLINNVFSAVTQVVEAPPTHTHTLSVITRRGEAPILFSPPEFVIEIHLEIWNNEILRPELPLSLSNSKLCRVYTTSTGAQNGTGRKFTKARTYTKRRFIRHDIWDMKDMRSSSVSICCVRSGSKHNKTDDSDFPSRQQEEKMWLWENLLQTEKTGTSAFRSPLDKHVSKQKMVDSTRLMLEYCRTGERKERGGTENVN